MSQTVKYEWAPRLSDLIDRAKKLPFEKFDEYLVQEAREACLQTIKEHGVGYKDPLWVAEWFEARITASHGSEELLNQTYLFMKRWTERDDAWSLRAMDFLINTLIDHEERRKKLSKMVFGFLVDYRSRFYWRSLALRKLITALLQRLIPTENEWRSYHLDEWHAVQRAIRAIVEHRDTTFLPQIESIYEGHLKVMESKEIRTLISGCVKGGCWPDHGVDMIHMSTSYDEFKGPMNATFLDTACKCLQQAKKDQSPDLAAALGTHLSKKTEVALTPYVRVEYPSALPYVAGQEQRITVRLMVLLGWGYQGSKEKNEMSQFTVKSGLMNCSVSCSHHGVDGFLYVHPETPSIKDPRGNRPTTRFIESQFRCQEMLEHHNHVCVEAAFSMVPTPGMNRFRLDIDDLLTGYESFVRTSGYVLCE